MNSGSTPVKAEIQLVNFVGDSVEEMNNFLSERVMGAGRDQKETR